MIVLIIIISGCVSFSLLRFFKSNTLRNQSIVSILIKLDSLLSYFLYSFNKTIRISVRIIIYDSHSSIYFSNFFPVGHFSRSIVLYGLEFIGIPVFPFQLIAPMFVEISNLSDFYFFIILILNRNLRHKEYISLLIHLVGCNQHISKPLL